jgi:hypothetical protein
MTIGAAGVAGADPGTTLTAVSPNSPSGQTVTPGTPFSSGQTVTVHVTGAALAAAGFTNGAQIAIEECAVPSGGGDPGSPVPVGVCDGNTHQGPTVTANLTNGINLTNYSILSLPDANLGESGGAPLCDLTDQCLLYIGENQLSSSAPHLWSQAFYVNPGDGTDDGLNPGDGLPEVPLAVGLPLAAGGIFGGSVLYRRRRSNRANAA